MKVNSLMFAALVMNTSFAIAGTMGPTCMPANVTVSCVVNAWDFAIQALYLQPVYGAEYGYFESFTDSSGHTTFNTEQPEWAWGFNLQGSYHFNTGNDLQVNWYHASKSYTKNFLTGTVFEPDNDVAHFKPQWDAVNFELGQHVDFGLIKNIRFHGGAQYTRIKVTQNNVTVNGQSFIQSDVLKFNGFGPRIGADFSYDIGSGFAVYAKEALVLLAGSNKFTRHLQIAGIPSASLGSKVAVVPGQEAKLGASYTHQIPQGSINLDAGYLWINYFDAIHVGRASGSGFDETDFALHGLYAGIKFIFAT